MSLASLEAFLELAHTDQRLQALLCEAPDASTVAAIARAAGYPVSELDLWEASAATPEEILPDPDALPGTEASAAGAPESLPAQQEPRPNSAILPDPWLEDDPIRGFLHQAQGDETLHQALSTAPDAAAVAAIAQAAGYPITAADLWRATGIPAEELFPPEPDLAPIEAPLARFLLEAEHDAVLLEALATAEDAAAVAAIAQAAGYPITAADLWEASDALPEELVISELIVFAVEEELPN
jgi:predicted ribosomally synthesized peptide with nif11-like leader